MQNNINISKGLDGNNKLMLYYQRPVQSRNKKIWLCYLKEEQCWALSTSPYFPKSVDLGYRWVDRTIGVIMLNMVSGIPFGCDDMFTTIERYNARLLSRS